MIEEHKAENNKLLDVRATPQKRHTEKADNESIKASADDTEKCSGEAEIGISTLATKAAKRKCQ